MRLRSSLDTASFHPVTTRVYFPIAAPEPVIPTEPMDQGGLNDLIKREQERAKAWAEKVKSLTKLEHSLFHWYVTCGVPKNRTCRELGLKTWQFEAIAKAAGEKLGFPLKTIRDERRAEAEPLTAAA